MTVKLPAIIGRSVCLLHLAGLLHAATPSPWDSALSSSETAWQAGQWQAVREQLAPVIAGASAPAAWRSVCHLRSARALLMEKQFTEAAKEFETIAHRAEYPEVHRAEALESIEECERLAKGLPARDAEATRVHIPHITDPGRVLHVAPHGSPDGDGSLQRPLPSIDAAMAVIRSAGPVPGGFAIELAPGKYVVRHTIDLSMADPTKLEQPLTIRAAKPGTAVLYGGAAITGFRPVSDPDVLKRLPEESRGKVVECDLKAQDITDFGKLGIRGYGLPFESAPPTLEVFSNGNPQTLARWPDKGFVKAASLLDPGNTNTGKPSVFTYMDDRPARWTRAGDAWLFGYFHANWADGSVPIGHIDPAAKSIATGVPYWLFGGMNDKQGIRYFAYNLLEEIDQPGEWYLDRKRGTLYWYPDGAPDKTTVEISMLPETMLRANRASRLCLQGLVFDCGRANGIELTDCSDSTVVGCTIRRFAGNGISITGGNRNSLASCAISTIGRRASEVTGGDRPTLTPGGHVVANCTFRDFGRIDRTYTPAIQLEGVGNRVTHNLFENCPSSAIRIEGNDHLIEYNVFRNVVLESDDQGAIDLWNNPSYRGIVFRHNLFEDIGDGTGQFAGQGGIRLDDVISGMTVYGNIFLRASRGFGGVQINCGRDNIMDRNLFIDCPVAVSGGYGDWAGYWKSLAENKPPTGYIDNPLYRKRYPELAHLLDDPKANHLWRNVLVRCGKFTGWDWANYDRIGNTMLNDEPGLLSDGRIQPAALVALYHRLGLRPIPLEEMGPWDAPPKP
jgi:parallel beta-helix repeat protein